MVHSVLKVPEFYHREHFRDNFHIPHYKYYLGKQSFEVQPYHASRLRRQSELSELVRGHAMTNLVDDHYIPEHNQDFVQGTVRLSKS